MNLTLYGDTMTFLARIEAAAITDDVGKFWVITKPTKASSLADICFEADIMYMKNQFRGGLEAKDIIGFYKSKPKAEKIAEKLLKELK